MREIVPPRSRGGAQSNFFLDGIARGRRASPPRKAEARPYAAAPLQRKKKQLDAVLLNKTKKGAFSWSQTKRTRRLLARQAYVLVRRVARRVGRVLPSFENLTPKKALYGSLVGGVSFGMVSMSLLQGFTSTDAQAGSNETGAIVASASEEALKEELQEGKKYNPNDDIFLEFFSEAEKEEYAQQIEDLVKGYPIEDVLPYILEKDRIVAAFLIGIAKKESNWGKRSPVLNGQDCFNYWGYRGVRRLMGTGGHTCFNSKKDAVDTVALRLETLIHSQNLDTPAKMVIWKCGYSCDGHSRESVRKWISDVDLYFEKLNNEAAEEEGNS